MGLDEIEFELKFVGTSTDIAALPQSRLLRAMGPREGAWERLCSTYYDTPGRDLERRGLSLRLREEAGGLVQAVKRPRDAGAVARAEHQRVLPSAGMFPAKTGDAEIDELIETLNGALRPVARTTVDRWAAKVGYGASTIELAVDLGRAESWNGEGARAEAPVAEAELELVDGDPGDIFELGRLVATNAPVRLSARTKLEAAAALSRGGLYAIDKEARLALTPKTPAGDALQLTLAGVAARIASLQPAILDARKAEGVHQMRVALRRLQAVERTFRPFLKSDALRNLAQRGRLFRKNMGDARDWDVFLEDTLPAATRNNYAPDGARRLRRRAEALRADAWVRAAAAVADKEFTAFLIDLTEAAAIPAWRAGADADLDAPLSDFAPRVLDRVRRKMLKTAGKIDRSSLAGYHPLRIALKKLRYPVQMFRPIYAKDARKEFMAALSALQEDFGTVNDAAVAGTLAGAAALGEGEEAMRAAGFICGYRAAEADAAARKIDADWAAFEAIKPFWRD